jgi:hypothetical protein
MASLTKPWKVGLKPKYHAIRNSLDGHNFDSLMEAEFYVWLKKNSDVNMKVHPKVQLLPGIKWSLDFFLKGVWYDVKGAETRDFKLKKKLWALFGPGDLIIVKKAPGLKIPWTFETIKSKGLVLHLPQHLE